MWWRGRRPHSGGSEGERLDEATRHGLEERFREPLGDVRIHEGAPAGEAARDAGAQAVTVGRDVYFAPGRYAPATDEGRRLLAHELAHVLQKRAAEEGAVPVGDPEASADRAAERVASGAPLAERLPAEDPARVSGKPGDWEDDVKAARALGDAAARASAMTDLVGKALGTGTTVHTAGTGSATAVNPKDYKATPAVNFDVGLNSKKSWPVGKDKETHSLADNYGYTFADGATVYVVLGPKALDPASPIFTRMAADHERFHARRHVGPAAKGTTASDADQELETYTEDFVNYFHQLRSFRPAWNPLVHFYGQASTSARSAALARLVAYHDKPPSPPIDASDVDAVRKSFEAWLKRRMGDEKTASAALVKDLAAKVKLP